MRTFSIQLPLVPLTEGQVVDRAAWPAHITLIGNFRADDADATKATIDDFAGITSSVRVAVEHEAWFGPDRTVLVDLLDVPLLRALHTELLRNLEAKIPKFDTLLPLHTRDGYWPHRTVTAGLRPAHGDVLEAARVSLAELDPPGRTGLAVILGIWPLKGSEQRA